MKAFLLFLFIAFTSCNDGAGNDDKGCIIVNIATLSPDQFEALQINGFGNGGVVQYQNLSVSQKEAFLIYGLDSMLCYNFQ